MKITAITVKNDHVKNDVVWVDNDNTAPESGDVMLAVGSIMRAFAHPLDPDLAGIRIEFTTEERSTR